MRISKTVREYIEREVRSRVMVKYEDEKKTVESQEKALNDFLDGYARVAQDTCNKYFEKYFPAIASFCTDNRENYSTNDFRFNRLAFVTGDRWPYNPPKESVFRWRDRFNDEVREKTDSIIVELELGGTKADLERLLNKI